MDQATLEAFDRGHGGLAVRLRAFELAAQVAGHRNLDAAGFVAEAKIIEAYIAGDSAGTKTSGG